MKTPRPPLPELPVRCLSRRKAQNKATPGLTNIVGDLADPRTLQGIADGCTTVFHCAGFAHARHDSDDAGPSPHERVTVEGTAALLEQAMGAGVQKLVFVSSAKATGAHPTRCLDEDAVDVDIDHYGETRRAAERLVLDAAGASGMHVCCLRPVLVYGPGVKGNLQRMLAAVDRGRFPSLEDTGNVRSMVHVHDLVRVIRQVADDPRAAGRVFHVTDGHAYSTRAIHELMAKALGRRLPGWAIPAAALRQLGRFGDGLSHLSSVFTALDSATVSRLLDSACYSNARLRSELGFEPAMDLASAIDEMVAAYRLAQQQS